MDTEYGTDYTTETGTDTGYDDGTTTETTTGTFESFDFDENGVIETVAGFVDGIGTIGLVDIDENGTTDYAEIDVNDDGIADASITVNGDGTYFMTMDADGDGVLETELTVTLADLEAEWPELAALITDGSVFGAATGTAPADPTGTEPTTPTDADTGPSGTTPALTPQDSDGDGIADLAWGTVQGVGEITVLDSDQNGAVDYAEIDVDGNGLVDASIEALPDGTFRMFFDTDGDGRLETELVVTEADIQAEWPELAGMLAAGAVFPAATAPADPTAPTDPATPATPADPTGTNPYGTDPTIVDPATADPATVDPTGTDPTGTDPYGNGTEPYVVDGTIVGDPSLYAEEWFYQSFNGACVPSAVAQVYEEYTGTDITEQDFVELTNEVGGWIVGPDGVPGLAAESAVELLDAVGIPAELMMGDMTGLADAVEQGRGVIVSVDSGDIWYGASDTDDVADHALIVTAIDFEAGVVYLSDTGDPEGNMSQVPIEDFERAWAASGNTMIVCDQSGADFRAANGIEEPAEEAAVGAVQSGTAGETAESRPWVMLPITLPASMLVRVG